MVVVQFSEKIDIQILFNIDKVQRVEEENPFIYKLQTSDPENIKKQILKFSLEKNWNILSLQSETKSLEDVFRNLTDNIQNN